MDKVCLVWVGTYSDKQVVAVYATRELAEQALKMMQDVRDEDGDEVYVFSSPRIEEMEVSKTAPVLYWYECVLEKDGSVKRTERDWRPTLSNEEVCSEYTNGDMRFYARGTTEEHAIKNAADFRRAWLAAHPEALTK